MAGSRGAGQTVADAGALAGLFRVFAEPTRLSVLVALARGGEATVSELVRAAGAPQPRVSDHLRVLARRGLVSSRREGRNVFYSAADARVVGILGLGGSFMADKPGRDG